MRSGDDSRQGEGSGGSEARHVVVVWDAPTRIFHWLAAVLVAAAYATWRLNWMEWHGRVGSGLLALLFFRLFWGFFGSVTARFSGFLASPRTACRHLAQILRREPDRQVGHNPAGGWMVLLLLALLLGETLTGVYIDNDIVNEGPLTEIIPARVANTIDALHGIFWNALLAAVLLHIAAILLYATVKRHNLLLPMITGRKTLSAGEPQPRMAGLVWAAFLFACSCVAAAALVKYL